MNSVMKFVIRSFVLSSLFLVEANSKRDEDDVSKLIRSRMAKESEFPHAAFMLVPMESGKKKERCGATIVTENKLFTACDCVAEFNYKGEPYLKPLEGFEVMAGAVELNSSEMQKTSISRIYLNPMCHVNKTLLNAQGRRDEVIEYDLAQFTVDPPFNFTPKLQAAKFLDDKTPEAYENFTTSLQKNRSLCEIPGWGTTAFHYFPNGTWGSDDGSPVLKVASVKMLSATDCASIFCKNMPWHWVCKYPHQQHLCLQQTTPSSGVDCYGDTGSGVIFDGYVIGTVSSRAGCDSALPSFYGKLSFQIQYLFGNTTPPTSFWKYTGNLKDLEEFLPKLVNETNSSSSTESTTDSVTAEASPKPFPYHELPKTPVNDKDTANINVPASKKKSIGSSVTYSTLLTSVMLLLSLSLKALN